MKMIENAAVISKPLIRPSTVKEKRQRRTVVRAAAWQKKLLPFMVTVLALLMLFFFSASAIQLYYLHQRIERSPELDLTPALAALDNDSAAAAEKLEMVRWKTLAILEGNTLQRRYHQANVLLMSRIWMAYLGFVTGMTLALVGATFILGKLKESESQVDGGSELWKFSITTASPGLVLAVLGAILMITTIVSHYEIQVNDGQLYTAGWNGAANSAPQEAADALPPPATFPADSEDEVIKTGDSKAKGKETKKPADQ